MPLAKRDRKQSKKMEKKPQADGSDPTKTQPTKVDPEAESETKEEPLSRPRKKVKTEEKLREDTNSPLHTSSPPHGEG